MGAAIAFQGGAIHPSTGEYAEAAIRHLQLGVDILKQGGSALDAVVQVVAAAEDDPKFHAGTGARLNLKGEVEFDASIMDGKAFEAGAVGGIQRVKNPIRVARAIMEETDHILLVGSEAEEIARKLGFETYDPVLPHRREEWEDLRAKLRSGEELEGQIYTYLKKIRRWADTVGACAMDKDGNFAAGTSSGGFPLKLPGRVGDVATIGAGTYAENQAGAVTITGAGETVIKTCLGFSVVQGMKTKSAQAVAEEHVRNLNKRFGNPLMFIVCIDKEGNVGSARNVNLTPHAYWQEGMETPVGNFAPVLE